MENLLAFSIISLMIIVIPGPDFFVVIKNTINESHTNGFMAALGIFCAHFIYSALATCGVVFILTSSYLVFTILKILGALYIAYLGVKSIISANQKISMRLNKKTTKEITLFNSYRQGFISTILNPKALLFYISILPQFVSTSDQATYQIGLLSLVFIITVLLWFSLCVFIFTYIKYLFEKKVFKMVFDYVVGIILLLLSISVLTTKN